MTSMSLSFSARVAQRLENSGRAVPATEGSTSPSLERLFRSPDKRSLVFSLLLFATVLVVYSPVVHNGFLNYDDDTYITNNPHVRAGVTGQTLKWAFTTFDAANYHPLTWLSHALDCQLFGVNPAAHHESNVLFHAANAVLLFLFLRGATGFAWRSLFVAALFALHPLNVESVAWAAERKNVLSMLFLLLALHAYVWYTRRPALSRYAVIFLIFALALLSKPQVITFPFLLFLLDYWPLGRLKTVPSEWGPEATMRTSPVFSAGWLVLEKIPLLLLSLASALVTMKAQQAGGAVQSLTQYSPLLRLETAIIAYASYLGKAFWPSRLVALYPHPTTLYPAWQVGLASLFLALVTAVIVRARRKRYLLVGWLCFLGTLVPMLGLVQVGAQAMAERYTYIPLIGIFVMVTWLVADWASDHQLPTTWLAVLALACLSVLGTLTYRQINYWHDTEHFWVRTLALTENNYIAHDSLGDFLASEGRNEEAAVQFRAALAIRSDDLPANLNLGTYEHGRGNLRAAIERYQLVALHAGDIGLRATAYGNLGSAYRQLGDYAQAKEYFDNALQLEPNRTMAMIGLGLVAQKEGDLPEAVKQYSHAMAMEPTDVGYLLLARALEQEGHPNEAAAIRERVAKLSPDLAAAEKDAASLLAGK
jgi:tetratricopeptide (TPR) repeat protein